MKPPAPRAASRLKPMRLAGRRSSSGKKPKRLTNIPPLLSGRGNGDIEDMKNLSAFLSPDMFRASFTSPRLTPPPFNLSFGSDLNDELLSYMDKLDGNMATCSTPLSLSHSSTAQQGACAGNIPNGTTSGILFNTSNPSNVKNQCATHIESSSFIKTPDKSTKNNLRMSSWGLPEKVLEQYARRGITSMFQWQAECLMLPGVLSGGNLVYSAPTSAGKTLIAELLALKCVLEMKRKVIVILPFVSIAQEKSTYLQQIFEPVGVKVGGFMGSQSPAGGFTAVDIAICTIEKANSLVNRLLEEKSCHQIGAVVVDELHMVGDSHRGYLLELLLTKLMYVTKKGRTVLAQTENDTRTHGSIQLIGMSATLPNLDTLASWLGAELYHTDFRPVPLKEMVKIGSTLYSKEIETIREFDKSESYPGDEDDILSLCAETVLQGHSVLIFCPTKNWCENLASTISRAQFLNGDETHARLDQPALLGVCEQLRRTQVGLDPVLEKSVPFGVAFHHAGLTFEEREIVEGAFRQTLIKILVATSTLSSGVNLPARLVIVRTPFFQRALLDVLVYKQMVGRAGRKGVDEAGESILICKPNEKSKVIGLLKSAPKPVQSCLGGQNGEKTGELAAMKRALLEVISSETATTTHEIETYIMCTLLYAEMANKSPEGDPAKSTKDLLIQSTLQFLMDNEFIAVRNASTKDAAPSSRSELGYYATQLGVATVASALSPDEAMVVFDELRKARRNFVLENELHIIYLVTPVYVQNQWPNIDWYKYLCLWERLPPGMRHVADTLGIRESFLARAIQGRILERTAAQRESLRIHRRFFTALALHGLVHEVPIAEVTRRYGASKGLLQTLQTAAGMFAGMVTVFCARLGWKNLELLLSQFQNRLTFGVERELCDLVRITLLNGFRARVLYNAGFHTLAAVATANPTTIETCLRNAVPFKSRRQLSGEEGTSVTTTWCAKMRRGMSESEASRIIIQEAQVILSEELHVPMSAWNNAQPIASVDLRTPSTGHNAQPIASVGSAWSNAQPISSVGSAWNNAQPIASVGSAWSNAQPIASVGSAWNNAQPIASVGSAWNNAQPIASIGSAWSNAQPIASVDLKTPSTGHKVAPSGVTAHPRGQRKSPNIETGGVKKPRISPSEEDKTHPSGASDNHLLLPSDKATVACSKPLKGGGPSIHQAVELLPREKPPLDFVELLPREKPPLDFVELLPREKPPLDFVELLPREKPPLDFVELLPREKPPLDFVPASSLVRNKETTNRQQLLPVNQQKTNQLLVDHKTNEQLLPMDQKTNKLSVDEQLLPMDQKTNKLSVDEQLLPMDQKTNKLPVDEQLLPMDQKTNKQLSPVDQKTNHQLPLAGPPIYQEASFPLPFGPPHDSQKKDNDLDLESSLDIIPFTIPDSFPSMDMSMSFSCQTLALIDDACTTKNEPADDKPLDAELLHCCKAPTTIAESPDINHPLNLKQVQGSTAALNLRSAQNGDQRACTDSNSQTPLTNKPSSKLPHPETPSQMSLKDLSSLCSSQLSQSGITIIDVTTNKRLFETFLSECLEQTRVSFSVATVSVDQGNGIGSVIVRPTEAPGIPLPHQNEQVVGVAFCWGDMDAYYLSLCHNPTGDKCTSLCSIPLQDRIQAVGKIMTASGLHREKLIAYDVKRHAKYLLLSCGVLPTGRVLDPRVACWLLDPDAKEKTIHKMALQYLPDQPLLSEEEGYDEMPLSSLATHAGDPQMRAAAEVVLSSLLMMKLETLLEAEDLYEPFVNVEMPSLLVLAKMELNGIGFSPEECNNQKEILEDRLGELEREAYSLARRSFSLTSPEDVAQVLFIELKLPPNLDGKQAKTLGPKGRRTTKRVQHLSTAKNVLEKIKSLHPLPRIVLEWRRISSTVTKNVFPLFKEAVSHPHIQSVRIHGNCQIHTATGRVTISDPSLQMIPKEYDIGPPRMGIPKFTLGSTDEALLSESQCFDVCHTTSESKRPSSVCMRNVFIAFPGGVFLAADYSQLELRILAHVSGDKKLQRFLNAEGDVFKMIAGEWLMLPPAEVSDKQRQQAKQVCYGMIYGIGAKALGEQLGISEDDAYQFMESFKSKYPTMKKFISKTIQDCKEKGHVCTLLERKRFLPGIHSSNIHARSQAERQAVNTTIQGSAADLVKTAMVNIDKRLAETFPSSLPSLSESTTRQHPHVTGAHLVLQLHDELLYEVCQENLHEVATIVRHEMENALKLSVKFPVKIKVGQTWGKLDPCNE